MDDFSSGRKSVETKNGEIAYWLDLSFPGRPTVLLLHGLSSNHTTWLNAVSALRNNRYNSLAPDLRGHGLSDKTKNKNLYDWPVFSEDLNRILRKENIKKFFLVGYSFGGQIAIDYASKHQEGIKGLILISANHFKPAAYRHLEFLTPIASGILNFLAALFLWQKRGKYHYYEHGKAAGYWDSVWDGLRTMPVSINFWMLRLAINADFKNAVKKITMPTLLVYGENDTFITKTEIEELARSVKNGRVIFSRNPDHFVGTNAQEETAEIILDFLKDHEASDF